jgi:hypothetical protein
VAVEALVQGQIVAIYIRVPMLEIERLRARPEVLPKYDPRVALSDGRAIDLGRAWEQLGVWLDGGVRLPERGPTIGDEPMPDVDTRAAWTFVSAERVAELAEMLAQHRKSFRKLYAVESDGETDPEMAAMRTGGYRRQDDYLMAKLGQLAAHYAAAAAAGEGMLVRIGERI